MKKVLLSCFLLSFLSIQSMAQCSTGEVEVQIEIKTDFYGYEGYWELVSIDSACGAGTILSGGNSLVGCNGGGAQTVTSGGYGNDQIYTSTTACLVEGSDYRIAYVDDWGEGGFKFTVYINGYIIEEFEGTTGFQYFTFEANEPPAFDMTTTKLSMPLYTDSGDLDVRFTVKNKGTTTINGLTANYSVDNGTTVSHAVSGLSIVNNETAEIIHPTPWAATNGQHEVSVWFTHLNGGVPDANPSDDELETIVHVGPGVPNLIDSYLTTLPMIVEIANDDVNDPTDLDFHTILTRKELWVLNKDSEGTGSSTVTISNAGEGNQSEVWKRDGNAWHFMSLSTGIAFSDNGNFGTSPGVYDANHNGGEAFTGPALWSSDMSVYAEPSGGNGSHLDMLHASPECQGIANETENVFWVFDGYNRDIVRYDFADDHGPGNDDHSDGQILRYSDFSVKPDPDNDIPSHLAYDKATDWLYVVDHGNQRVVKIDTKTGTVGGTPSFGPYEELAQYENVTGYDWETVVDEGLEKPVGIDLIDDYMLISDYATGQVIIYDISTTPAIEKRRLETEAEGIMGIKIGPDGRIWFVDHDAETVNRLDWIPGSVFGVAEQAETKSFRVYPNPNNGTFKVVNSQGLNAKFEMYNTLGARVSSGAILAGSNQVELDLPSGFYVLRITDSSGAAQSETMVIR